MLIFEKKRSKKTKKVQRRPVMHLQNDFCGVILGLNKFKHKRDNFL